MNVLGLLQRKLTSERIDARVGQIVCWLVSVLILIVGFYAVTRLPHSEAELLMGVLLVIILSVSGVILGILLPIAEMAERMQEEFENRK